MFILVLFVMVSTVVLTGVILYRHFSDFNIDLSYLHDNGILRMSGTESSVWPAAMEILFPIIIVLITALAVAMLLASKMSEAITRPINEIDLSAPKRETIYKELEPLVDRLEQQNIQISDYIRELKFEHERRDSIRRDFTANVSHELKTPLTSISGFAEIIQNGIAKEEDIKRFAEKIHNESQRLIILVGNIIKISEFDSRKTNITLEPVDLFEVSAAVISHLEDAAEKLNVTLKLKGGRMIIVGVEQIIEEMIFNLIDNAIKYNRPGGNVTIDICRSEVGIELSVSDTGTGIAEEDKSRIFERFYRVDKSHEREVGGTGLGLAIVKHGANFHNASISVSSVVDTGTTIKVIF